MGLDISTMPEKSGGSAYGLLALQLGSLGFSAIQTRNARRRLEALTQPNAPLPTRNPLLAQRISQAQQEAQLGTDVFRREREASTARATEQGRQISSQMGGATYGAMMQNQLATADRARREGLVQDEGLRMQRQQQLDQLINMDMSQDARADQMNMQRFGAEFNFFNRQFEMYNANQLQGQQNMLNSFAALGADLPENSKAFKPLGSYMETQARLLRDPQSRRIFRQGLPLIDRPADVERMQMPNGVNPFNSRTTMQPIFPMQFGNN